MHVLYVLSLLPTYRETILSFLAHHSLPVANRYYQTMLESVYLQKSLLSLSKLGHNVEGFCVNSINSSQHTSYTRCCSLCLIVGLQNRMCVHPEFLHSNATSHKWPFGGMLLCGFRLLFQTTVLVIVALCLTFFALLQLWQSCWTMRWMR